MTFKAATETHLRNLAALGWAVRTGLKIPHATAPDGSGLRIWFKPQAVHWSTGTDFGAARSIHEDMRTATTARLVEVARYFAAAV